MTRRPRISPAVPVLQIGPHTVRAGLTTPVVWEDAPPRAAAALAALDGTATVAEAAAAHRVSELWLHDRIRELAALGWLVRRPSARVAVVGAGLLAEAMARALVGVAEVRPLPRPPVHLPTEDVVVWATDTAAADRLAVATLVGGGLPHLLVEPSERGATVGPFVVPGRTPCRQCLDLWLQARQPAWGTVTARAARHRSTPDAPALAWAAGLAAAHVAAWLSDGSCESMAATWDLDRGRTEIRSWRPHPDCACATVDDQGCGRLVA